MSQIVHITFEKLTGLNGTIEGDFICDPQKIDLRIPIIFKHYIPIMGGLLIFEQLGRTIDMEFIPSQSIADCVNYITHFRYGTNFLIKEWSYGSGVDTGSKNPN